MHNPRHHDVHDGIPALQAGAGRLRAAEASLPPARGPRTVGTDHGDAPRMHSISLTNGYGGVVSTEEASSEDFAVVLRRFHAQAVERASCVVVLDGIIHTRNAFLEFVREFNECTARAARVPSPAKVH